MPPNCTLRGLTWPEIGPGDDLVALAAAIDDLRDGDIVLITSKIVSKAEGRLVHEDRPAAIVRESRRVVARRGLSVIAETRQGLVMAAAGVDSSNTPAGTSLLLPLDPDRSARLLRQGVHGASGLNIGVVVTDTAGRAWRLGQADMAVGCAGVVPLLDLQGTRDTHGNQLLVTAPAVADELAAAADLVKGKATGRPVAVVRGLGVLVLPPGEHGPGAVSLVRPPAEDLFGLGAREAVTAAAHRSDTVALERIPTWSTADPDPFDGLLEGWRGSLTEAAQPVHAEVTRDGCATASASRTWTLRVAVPEDADPEALVAAGRLLERADTLAAGCRLRAHIHDDPAVTPGWRHIARTCWQDR